MRAPIESTASVGRASDAQALAAHVAARTTRSALADYLTLTKPRIASLVALSAFIGGLLAGGPNADLLRTLEATLWIAATAASASVFNQVLERDVDRRMRRTADRPLPAGRLSVRDAILFGAFLALSGVIGLALRFNLLAALLALATLFTYVAIYTPLKRASTLNTVIGALPGAAPPLLGYVALSGAAGDWGWALFAIVFVWQFPHFMAIAWLYREDYASAGMQMLPALPGCSKIAARAALVYSLVLLPIALLPGVWGSAGIVYTLGTLLCGLAYVAASARFALREDRASARLVLWTSLVYLPLVFSLILLDPVVGVAAMH